jgi:DNA (cytosine-5)-methyltransferase 1
MYAANSGETPEGDVHNAAAADIAALDMLYVSYPFQPFSVAGVSRRLSLGRERGFEDQVSIRARVCRGW